MRFLIYAKGTKIKLTQPWEVHTHPGQYDVSASRTFVLAKGTVLSIHDIDIRGNARYPKSMGFYICKGGCPMNPELEQSGFIVSLTEAANAEFELNGKVDAKLNDLDLALVQMNEEIKQNK
jgi:hypothetical protein